MSLQEIKVSREEVLKIVQENKEKHDTILKGAIEGYWLEAETYLKKFEKDELERINKTHRDQLKQLRKQRKEAMKLLKTRVKEDLGKVKDRERTKGFVYWRNAYPEDHGDDYAGTIRRLELCVEPEVKLDMGEFDSYIRNKWSWRNSFITSNTGYVSSYALSASWANSSISSSYALNSTPWHGTGSLSILSTF